MSKQQGRQPSKRYQLIIVESIASAYAFSHYCNPRTQSLPNCSHLRLSLRVADGTNSFPMKNVARILRQTTSFFIFPRIHTIRKKISERALIKGDVGNVVIE
jgi:hypothetical protein